jgi:hypothetical protein
MMEAQHPFIFQSGKQTRTLQEFVEICLQESATYPVQVVQQYYNQDFENWLRTSLLRLDLGKRVRRIRNRYQGDPATGLKECLLMLAEEANFLAAPRFIETQALVEHWLQVGKKQFIGLEESFKTSGDPQSAWLAFKAKAGAEVIQTFFHERQPPKEVLPNLVSLYKEIGAAFVQRRAVFGQYQHVQICAEEVRIIRLGAILNDLCMLLDAVDDGVTPRLGFLKIAYASGEMEECFSQVADRVTSWYQHFQQNTLSRSISKTISTVRKMVRKQLITKSGQVKGEAKKAARAGCDIEQMRQSYTKISADLTALHISYKDILCEFDHLKCAPDLEPPLMTAVQTGLEEAGYALANALRALKAIYITEENWVQQLQQDWRAIDQQAKAIREESKRWAHNQLCPPPDFCQAAMKCLLNYTEQALKYVSTLQPTLTGGDTLAALDKLVNQVDAELVTLSSQAAQLKSQGFNTGLFDKFWWRIVRIRLIVDEQRKAKDPQVSLEQQLAQLIKRVVGIGTKSNGVQTDYSIMSGLAIGLQPVTLLESGYLQQLPDIQDIWKQAELLVNDLKTKVPQPLHASLTALLNQAQIEQRWLQEYVATGKVPTEVAQQRVDYQWSQSYAGIAAVIAVAQDSTKDEERQKLAVVKEQLEASHLKLKFVLGISGAVAE